MWCFVELGPLKFKRAWRVLPGLQQQQQAVPGFKNCREAAVLPSPTSSLPPQSTYHMVVCPSRAVQLAKSSDSDVMGQIRWANPGWEVQLGSVPRPCSPQRRVLAAWDGDCPHGRHVCMSVCSLQRSVSSWPLHASTTQKTSCRAGQQGTAQARLSSYARQPASRYSLAALAGLAALMTPLRARPGAAGGRLNSSEPGQAEGLCTARSPLRGRRGGPMHRSCPAARLGSQPVLQEARGPQALSQQRCRPAAPASRARWPTPPH